MEKTTSSAVMTPSCQDKAQPADTIWCKHFECYKYLKVCSRCRVRIKCGSFQDYWSPRFEF